MKTISTSDVATIRRIAGTGIFKSANLYPAAEDGHKFKPGQRARLVGLVDFPEFNGDEVTISDIREDGPKGKAYYVQGRCTETINWVYEYRLEARP